MRRLVIHLSALALLLLSAACEPIYPKGTQRITFRADGSGSLSLKLSGQKLDPNSEKTFEERESEWLAETKERRERMTRLGFSVTTCTTTEVEGEDGQEKTMAFEASFSDANTWLATVKAQAAVQQAPRAENQVPSLAEDLLALALLGSHAATHIDAGCRGMVNLLQFEFLETERPGVGRLMILPTLRKRMTQCRISADPLPRIAALPVADLEKTEKELTKVRQEWLEELAWTIQVSVPGEIVATNGCAKSHDGQSVSWRITRDEISLSALKIILQNTKDGVWVDFKIPAGCALAFKKPVSESSPTPAKDAPRKN
jgi:hypothetical protein